MEAEVRGLQLPLGQDNGAEIPAWGGFARTQVPIPISPLSGLEGCWGSWHPSQRERGGHLAAQPLLCWADNGGQQVQPVLEPAPGNRGRMGRHPLCHPPTQNWARHAGLKQAATNPNTPSCRAQQLEADLSPRAS